MGKNTPTEVTNHRYDLKALHRDQDRSCVFPIHFSYDYMANALKYLAVPPPLVVFSNACHEIIRETRQNSVPLDPTSAKLPWYTGLTSLRRNKYWKTNLQCTADLLQLFAEDVNLNKAQIDNGLGLANSRNWSLKLIPLIDIADKWEETATEHVTYDRDHFVQLIQGNFESMICETPLQKRIAEVHRGFLDADNVAGNGGADVIKTLLEFSQHCPPMHSFLTVREYLDYRYVDIAMPYSYACAKFSIQSDINLQDTKLNRYLHLVGDYFSIVNDLASYDKEKRNFEDGHAKYLINIVSVVQKLIGLQDLGTAKSVCYTMQLQTEQAISEELERLKCADELTNAQWKFKDSVLIMAAGNLFTSVVISRYGGVTARIVDEFV